jgi:hypothetical protein
LEFLQKNQPFDPKGVTRFVYAFGEGMIGCHAHKREGHEFESLQIVSCPAR